MESDTDGLEVRRQLSRREATRLIRILIEERAQAGHGPTFYQAQCERALETAIAPPGEPLPNTEELIRRVEEVYADGEFLPSTRGAVLDWVGSMQLHPTPKRSRWAFWRR